MLPAGYRPHDVHEQRFQVEFDYPVAFVQGVLAVDSTGIRLAVTRRETGGGAARFTRCSTAAWSPHS
jgi:hypothetical protein